MNIIGMNAYFRGYIMSTKTKKMQDKIVITRANNLSIDIVDLLEYKAFIDNLKHDPNSLISSQIVPLLDIK